MVRKATRRDQTLVKLVNKGLGRKEPYKGPYTQVLDEFSYVMMLLVRGNKALIPGE